MRKHTMLALILLASCSSEPQVPEEFAGRYRIKEYLEEDRLGGRHRQAVIESKDEGLLPGTFLAEHLAATDGASCLAIVTAAGAVNMVDRDNDGAIDVYASGGGKDRLVWTRQAGWKSRPEGFAESDGDRLLERGQRVFDTCTALLGVGMKRKD